MGTSASQHADFVKNEYLVRFAGEESISPNDPFWNRFLSFTLKAPQESLDDSILSESLKSIYESLLKHNLKTGNLAALLHVLISRSSEVLISTQLENTMFNWQTYNALFVVRCYLKYLVHNVKESDVIRHIETQGSGSETKVEGLILEMYVTSLMNLIINIPVIDFTYKLHIEAINSLLVLLSTQMNSTVPADQLQIYRVVMSSDKAELLTKSLLHRYMEQMKSPENLGGSLLIGLASELWSLLTLNYGPTEQENSPLANQAILLLLVLINHCTSSATKNVYRETISTFSGDMGLLLNVICQTLHREETTLFLYHLIHCNSSFKTYLLSRSDIESLVVPMLKSVYHVPDNNCHHMYMSLINLLILTEDQLFNKTLHSTMLKGITWYTERMIPEISLGGLMILVTTRTVQYNLLKMRDKYLHTNCLAALANMSAEFTQLHPYVCQRLVGLFEVLARTHARANNELSAVEEALRILLEVINSCLSNQLIHNTNLVYTLLYKREVFDPFRKHPAFQDVVQNIDMVIEYFSSKLEKEEEQSGDVNTVLARVQHAALQWPRNRLKKFPELKFKYVEEEKPEEFFVPYVWTLVAQFSGLHFDAFSLKQS
uniref:Dymeclin n=2 Tax=Clastoptera arizonana TaxID=38151 RepID=A0A1B6CTK8_9HEMI